jgi:hypothetical protein
MGLALTTNTGLPITARTALPVTVTSSSAQGTFSTSPLGPWSPTLSLTVAAGASTTGSFYYLDTHAGNPVITASAEGVTSATQTQTVTPGPAVSLVVTPASADVPAQGSLDFGAQAGDSFGNLFPITATWSLAPETLGTIVPASGTTTTFTAQRTLGEATLTAVAATETGTVSATASVRVVAGRLRIGSIAYRGGKGVAFLTLSTLDAGNRPVSDALLYVTVRRDGRLHFTARALTGPAGRHVFRIPLRKGGCISTTVRRATAAGFVWDGRTPANRYCTPGSA